MGVRPAALEQQLGELADPGRQASDRLQQIPGGQVVTVLVTISV